MGVTGRKPRGTLRVNGQGQVPGLSSTLFLQSAQEYRQRSLLEKELLFFAYDVFGIPFVDPVSQSTAAGRMGKCEGARDEGKWCAV